jgi:undecaprenyl-diphosphatase
LHQFVFRWREKGTRDYLLKILLAFAITGVGGLALEKAGFELPESLLPVAWAMIVGGVLFLLIESRMQGRQTQGEMTWLVAAIAGIGQLLAAVFPGTSRSGATILLMLLLGMSRPAATEFSFLIGIPTMLAASGLKIFTAMQQPANDATPERWDFVLLGLAVSAAVSFMAVKWLLRYIQTHTFVIFGWYRIALGALIFLLLFTQS